jgi:hypothetical protein
MEMLLLASAGYEGLRCFTPGQIQDQASCLGAHGLPPPRVQENQASHTRKPCIEFRMALLHTVKTRFISRIVWQLYTSVENPRPLVQLATANLGPAPPASVPICNNHCAELFYTRNAKHGNGSPLVSLLANVAALYEYAWIRQGMRGRGWIGRCASKPSLRGTVREVKKCPFMASFGSGRCRQRPLF